MTKLYTTRFSKYIWSFQKQPPEVFCQKGVLGNFTKLTRKKETLAQVFSSEFCEISKNTFFTEHLLVAASIIFNIIRKKIN